MLGSRARSWGKSIDDSPERTYLIVPGQRIPNEDIVLRLLRHLAREQLVVLAEQLVACVFWIPTGIGIVTRVLPSKIPIPTASDAPAAGPDALSITARAETWLRDATPGLPGVHIEAVPDAVNKVFVGIEIVARRVEAHGRHLQADALALGLR